MKFLMSSSAWCRDLAAVQRLNLGDDELVLLDSVGEAHEEQPVRLRAAAPSRPCRMPPAAATAPQRRPAACWPRWPVFRRNRRGVEGVAVGGTPWPPITAPDFLREKRLHLGEQGLTGNGSRVLMAVYCFGGCAPRTGRKSRRNPTGGAWPSAWLSPSPGRTSFMKRKKSESVERIRVSCSESGLVGSAFCGTRRIHGPRHCRPRRRWRPPWRRLHRGFVAAAGRPWTGWFSARVPADPGFLRLHRRLRSGT